MVSRIQVVIMSLNGMELPAGNLTCLPQAMDSSWSLLVLAPLLPPRRRPGHRERSKLSTRTDSAPAPQTVSSQTRMGGSGRSQPRVGLRGARPRCRVGKWESGSAGRAAGAAPRRTWPGSRRALSRNSPRAKEAWASPAGRLSPSVPGCPAAAPHCNPRDPRFPPLRTPLWRICGRPNRWLPAGCGGALQRAQPWKTLGCSRPAPRPPCPAQPSPAQPALCLPRRGLCQPRGCRLWNTCSSGAGWGSTRAPGIRSFPGATGSAPAARKQLLSLGS